MGSQNKANLTRVRDNQRRSRARRKEYVLELEKRLRLCELQGVEASFEIQQAARRVVEENKKMRALLNSLGFRNERINSILRTGNLDPAEPIILNPLDDPENMVRTVELLLTPRQLKCPDSRPQTTAPIAAAVVCNSIDNDVANLLGSSQTKVEIRPPKTSTPTPVQLPTSPALSEPNHFEFETQEYSQSLMSSAPPGHPLGGQQQHLSGLVMLPSKPPLVEASEFDTNLGAHEFIYYGRGTNVQRHLEENPTFSPEKGEQLYFGYQHVSNHYTS
ncbi:hypothetical protein AAE478_000439 [Parahypoxylon ruwenzoriense]